MPEDSKPKIVGRVTLVVEVDDSGLVIVTSPDAKGLRVAALSFEKAMALVHEALGSMGEALLNQEGESTQEDGWTMVVTGKRRPRA